MKLKIRGTNEQKSALYPNITDQLDAIWKILEEADLTIPESARPILTKIKKTKHILRTTKHKGATP